MGFFSGLKKVVGASTSELKAQYAENKDFLEAVCAAAALVAAADGEIEDSEISATIKQVAQNPKLSEIYNREIIESTLQTMLKRATSSSGKAQLGRELTDVAARPGTKQMCEDIYLTAVDVASADGEVEDAEKAVLTKIAKILNVDEKAVGF